MSAVLFENIRIRESSPRDEPAITRLLHEAFGEAQGREISQLVTDLIREFPVSGALSLVAEAADEVVGHILFTSVQIIDPGNECKAAILAPLAVHPSHQRQGVGGRLILEGLTRAKNDGAKLVFVLGHPAYYSRHGFLPAGARGFDAPYPIDPVNADAWMVHELMPGTIGSVHGRIVCAQALMDPRHWRE